MDIKSFDSLFARLEDLKECAGRGSLGVSAFFSPREELAASEYLKRAKAAFISFGGYTDAERRKIYILPDYIELLEDNDGIGVICDFGFSTDIDCVRIKGSGFEELSHRAVMGSILGLGVERDAIGDIVMLDRHNAVFFCESRLTAFFEENLERVGRDKVKTLRIELDENIIPERKTQKISDTVASARLDCVVSALCSFSRERAKEAILSSLVELNYECEERADREVSVPAVISVRGFGKFKIISLSDKTKKGRYRLMAEKFI
jgi:RNA-binding protein YlmH